MLEMYTATAITIFLFYIAYKGNHPTSKDTAHRDIKGRYTKRVTKRVPRQIPVTINGVSQGSITL